MSRIKSRGTSIEKTFKKELRRQKIKFQSNVESLFGKPDFVIQNKRTAIFCDSSFWHGYKYGKTKRHRFRSNKAFWRDKITANIKRDKSVNAKLKAEGWTVLRFWDFEIKKDVERCVERIRGNHPK